MTNVSEYERIFNYLSTPDAPSDPEVTVVFGRNDTRVAQAMGNLASAGLASKFIVTGKFGKDSDFLTTYGIPESVFLAEVAQQEYGIHQDMIRLEQEATNGAENALNSLKIIGDEHPHIDAVTVLAHATSLRRLAEGLRHKVALNGAGPNTIHRVPTNYQFDPTDPSDQAEAEAELLRLADWPEKGWLQPQPNLPTDLVEFARAQAEARKKLA